MKGENVWAIKDSYDTLRYEKPGGGAAHQKIMEITPALWYSFFLYMWEESNGVP